MIAPASLEGRSAVTVALPDGAWVDVDAASEALHRAEAAVAQRHFVDAWSPARVALHIAGRGFLSDHDAAWIEPHRARVEDIYLRALDCYGRACLEIGERSYRVPSAVPARCCALLPTGRAATAC